MLAVVIHGFLFVLVSYPGLAHLEALIDAPEPAGGTYLNAPN